MALCDLLDAAEDLAVALQLNHHSRHVRAVDGYYLSAKTVDKCYRIIFAARERPSEDLAAQVFRIFAADFGTPIRTPCYLISVTGAKVQLHGWLVQIKIRRDHGS